MARKGSRSITRLQSRSIGIGGLTYKDAGVDIEAGEEMVRRIRSYVERTHNPHVFKPEKTDLYGGFAGLYRLNHPAGIFKRQYKDPLWVACTDGVGTKTKIATGMKILDTIGIDCVAMNVNDMICCGAEPRFFLDYIGTGKLTPKRMAEIVKGVSDGCLQAGCALLGGETAEMPDIYRADDIDLAGFAVGVVEEKRMIDGSAVKPGDVAVALASDGLHSNGYGLARRVLLEKAKYKLTDRPPELEGASVGEELLKPTRIYVKSVLEVLGAYKRKRVVKAMVHVTGGGLGGNLPRVLPKGISVRVKRDSWYVPPIFRLIAAKGPVDQIEMMRVFNMGIGFVMIVAPGFAASVMNRLRRAGERCWVLGKICKGSGGLVWA